MVARLDERRSKTRTWNALKMKEEIVNRVAKSSLITIDLEDYYPAEPRTLLDVKDWLFEGLILKENEFRATLKNFDWLQFKDHHMAPLREAIIPAWAYMLIQTHLKDVAKTVVVGSLDNLESFIYKSIVDGLDLDFCKTNQLSSKDAQTNLSHKMLTSCLFKNYNHWPNPLCMEKLAHLYLFSRRRKI